MQTEKLNNSRLAALLIFLAATVLNQLYIPNEYAAYMRMVIVSLGYIAGLSLWTLHSARRCGEKQLRHFLLWEYACLDALLVIRCIKYGIENPVAEVYLWYISYIPIIMLPLIFFLSTLKIETGERISRKYVLLFIPATLLALGIISNNYHHLAFDFVENYAVNSHDYTRGILYYLVFVWVFMFFFAGMANAFRKCRLSSRKNGRILLILLLLSTAVYIIYYFHGPFFLRTFILGFYDSQSVAFALMYEICLDCGLFPVNDDDGRILKNSSLWLTITDKSGIPVWSPEPKLTFTSGDFAASQKGKIITGSGFELVHHRIHGGHAYFAGDVSSLIEVNRKLEEAHSILLEEQAVLDGKNAALEKIKIAENQNRIYEKIDGLLSAEAELIRSILNSGEPDLKKKLGKVCIAASFMKRRGNLLILSEQTDRIPAGEAELCFSETVRYLNSYGIFAAFYANCSEDLYISDVLSAYGVFEETAKTVWDCATAVIVKLSDVAEGFELAVELGGELGPETVSRLRCLAAEPGKTAGKLTVETDTDNCTLYLSARFGGEAV